MEKLEEDWNGLQLGLWKLVSLTGIESLFMLCKLWKWINQHVTSVGQRKIWVPDRIQTYDLPINTRWALYPLELQRTHDEWGPILGSYLTLILPTTIYMFLGDNLFVWHNAVIFPFTCILSSSVANNKNTSQLALLTNELDWMSWMEWMNYDTAPLNPTPSNPYTTSQML